MKRCLFTMTLVVLPFASVQYVGAQSFTVDWHTIDGGGGTSTGGGFELSGTIGQCDAQPAPVMTDGTFTLAGGFWPGTSANVCTLPGDMNGDGRIDGDDVQLFVNCAIAGTGSCGCADFDGGGVGAGDVPAFIAALLGP